MSNCIIDKRLFPIGSRITNGRKTVDITTLDLMRASLTVGYPITFSTLWDNLSIYMYKFLRLPGLFWLFTTDNGDLKIRDFVYRLTQSDKNVLSYDLGMILTKVAAEKEMFIPWLRHADELITNKIALLGKTKKRGDLIGKDKFNDWHVIEAKGRLTNPSRKVIDDAKKQSQNIKSINGSSPKTTSASINYLFKTPIEIIIEDPPNDKAEREVNFEETDFFTGYYLRLITLLQSFDRETSVYGQNKYSTLSITINNRTFQIGLLEELFNEPARAFEIVSNREFNRETNNKNEQVSFGNDGTMIRVGVG